MSQDVIVPPKVVEGEVLGEEKPESEADALYALLAEIEGDIEVALEVAQRIDHGMTDVRPNKPNREIVRVLDGILATIRAKWEAVGMAELEDNSNEPTLIEGKPHE